MIISATIRRDLHRPFRRFSKFNVVHAYMDASYGDMDKEDFGGSRQFKSIAELEVLLNELNPDLVQAPEPAASRLMMRACWEVWQWHKRTGKPYFFPMFENLPMRHKFGSAIGAFVGWFLGVFGRDASWIYVLNQEAKDTLATVGVTGKKVIRANWGNWGVDPTEFKPAKQPAKTRTAKPTVLFIGRLSTGKGVDDLLEAFRAAKVALPDAELMLVGPKNDGGLGGKTAELIQTAELMEGVTLVGPKKQRELPEIIQRAWVVVLLSKTLKRWAEQVGMVNLQSLACGTPIVTSDSGSIPEYLSEERIGKAGNGQVVDTKHGAFIVHEGDVPAATKAIMEILRDPTKRETMGEQGVAWIGKTFNEVENVPALEALTFEQWQQTK